MKKIIAISASNNPASINYDLLVAATNKLTRTDVQLITFTGLSLPLYSEATEKTEGIPVFIRELYRHFAIADGFMLASPEHNGLPPACFKNILDWLSRINKKIFHNKPVLLLSTSPGLNGGSSSLQLLARLLPHWGAVVAADFSLGNFYTQFDRDSKKIINTEEDQRLTTAVLQLEELILPTEEMIVTE